MLFVWACWIVLLLVGTSQQSGFSSPDFVTPYGPGAHENVVVWYVGETRKVVYDISDTGLEDYTVALWQQSVSGGGATQGPVVDSVALPLVSNSFEWVVALDGFDLDVSPLFFFWIFNGSSSNQGNTAYKDVSSAYFNISSDDPPSSSVSTSTTSNAYSTILPAPISTDIVTISSSSMDASMQTSTQAVSSSASSSATTISDSKPSGSSSRSSGLSTGAGVGIGVGVGLAGICAVICAVIVVRGKRQKAKEELYELPPYNIVEDKSRQVGPYNSYTGNPPGPRALNAGRPVEMNARGDSPIELYAGPE